LSGVLLVFWKDYLAAGLLVAFALLVKYADVSVLTWVLLLAVPSVGLMLATSFSGSIAGSHLARTRPDGREHVTNPNGVTVNSQG
jgi:hypothetical protein